MLVIIYIGFDGSRTNILGVVAQNTTAEIGRECLKAKLTITWP